jgi:mannose-1-phosphate guanylyltransferase
LAARRWAIVLAAGEGARVRALTTDDNGDGIPKQYWAPLGTRPMLQWALERAGRIVSQDRVVTIVAAQHRSWWQDSLRGQPTENVVVQPMDRGTGVGVLLPLLSVYLRDRRAIVALIPSDHFIEEEGLLRESFRRAFSLIEAGRRILLLGVTPDRMDSEYGWVLAGEPGPDGTSRVVSFHEKPGPALARILYRRRAVWSSFMLAARAETLLSIYEQAAPRLLTRVARTVKERGWGPDALEPLYESIPTLDFSRDLLRTAPHRLRLIVVPPCGWTDLGTPARIARWMAAHVPKALAS